MFYSMASLNDIMFVLCADADVLRIYKTIGRAECKERRADSQRREIHMRIRKEKYQDEVRKRNGGAMFYGGASEDFSNEKGVGGVDWKTSVTVLLYAALIVTIVSMSIKLILSSTMKDKGIYVSYSHAAENSPSLVSTSRLTSGIDPKKETYINALAYNPPTQWDMYVR